MPDVKISALPAATSVSDADVLVINQGSPATTKKVTYGTIVPTVNANVGTFGSDSSVAQVTVDVKGRVTAAASVPIDATNISTGTLPVARGGTGASTHTAAAYLKGNGTGAIVSQTGIPAGDITSGTLPVARGGTGASTLTGFVKASGTNAMTASATVALASEVAGTLPVANGGTGATTLAAGQFLKGNGTSAIATQSGILAADLPAFTGDVTTTAGSTATTLANTAVAAGTYGSSSQVGSFTVDAKGRLTSASQTAISAPAIGAPRISSGQTGVSMVLTPSTYQIIPVTVANANLGVPAVAALDAATTPTAGLPLTISAYCSAAGTVTVVLLNLTGSNIGFTGNIRATVFY